MSLVITPGYSWVNGEVMTATKLNLAAVPTIADGQAGVFSTISTTGNPTIGNGTTGTTLAVVEVYGGSASSGGSYINFRRNAISQGAVGNESGIIGNNSSSLLIYGGVNDVKFSAGGAGTVGQFSSTGLAVTGALSATGGITLSTTYEGRVYCTADATAAATLTAGAPGLSVTLVSGKKYCFEAYLRISGNSNNSGFAMAGTVTRNSSWARLAAWNGTVFAMQSATDTGWPLTGYQPGTGASADWVGEINGYMDVNTGGTFKVQVFTGGPSGSTTVKAGSYFNVWCVG